MTHGSLFSGIGGFDLAAERMGWENLFHCEWNEFGQRVLKYHFPKSESFSDITKSDFTKYANKIDVLSGGFPCQPYSVAGHRKGKEDERHLFPEMLRVIREVRPRWVVGENVLGIVSWSGGLVFHEVQTDLEAAGYEVLPFVLPACGKNAPHKRERVWFIAHASSYGRPEKAQRESESDKENREPPERLHNSDATADTDPNNLKAGPKTHDQPSNTNAHNGSRIITAPYYQRLQQQPGNKITDESGQLSRFFEESGFDNFPTQPPICGGDDGISRDMDGISFSKWRIESIKAYGNAIVPQVAQEIFRAIEKYEALIK